MKPTLFGNFNIVLLALTKALFDPLVSCSVTHLSMKVVFLDAITSVRRVGELGALMADPLYTVFHRDVVSLRLHPKFIPKSISEFHLSQVIHLPVFYPSCMPPKRTENPTLWVSIKSWYSTSRGQNALGNLQNCLYPLLSFSGVPQTV